MLLKEIIGQTEIKNRLLKSVQEGRVPHAQLLYGNEGVGKMPLALAYAQYISCTNRTEKDSCGVCPSCIKFQRKIHPDLHFVFPFAKGENVMIFSRNGENPPQKTLILGFPIG